MKGNTELIESLLYEDEGTALDFKRDQYLFENASKEEKSELLKDILAFANSFRRTDAYILVGVEEVKGGRSTVVGVSAQLDDAKLQQFVNSKTQRTVVFSYRELQHDGLPIGIIHIPLQTRPIHTNSTYGKVEKQAVYIRRGSSTAIASPDEIAQMGLEQSGINSAEPCLELELVESTTGRSLGLEAEVQCTWLEIPPQKKLPDYFGPANTFSIGINKEYYRKLAKFIQTVNFLRPISLAITNSGSVVAHDVRLLFEISDPESVFNFVAESEMPLPPKSQTFPGELNLSGIPALSSDISVSTNGDSWRVECHFGKIQPGESRKLDDDLYLAARKSGPVSVHAQLYADNIGSPRSADFQIIFHAESYAVTLEEIEKKEMERFVASEEGQRLLAESQSGDG